MSHHHHHHHHHHPPTTQQPPSPPPLNHLPPPSPHHNSNTITDDQYEQQQLISNLLSLSPTSSDKTTSFPFQQQVKFVSYPYFLPFESSSSSYITINGNEETCGSSFSDTDSSVMASFDTTAYCFLFSDAFSGHLLTPHDIQDDDNDHLPTLLQTRELDVLDEDRAWDWTVFSGHSQERD